MTIPIHYHLCTGCPPSPPEHDGGLPPASDHLGSRCGLTHLLSLAKPEAVLSYLESTLGVPRPPIQIFRRK